MQLNAQKIISVLGIFIAITLAWFLRNIIAYFLVAAIVSFLGTPLVDGIEKKVKLFKKPFPRWLASLLVLCVFIFLVFGIIYILIPPLITQAENISKISAVDFKKSFAEPIQNFRNSMVKLGMDASLLTVENIKAQFFQYLNTINFSQSVQKIWGGVNSALGWIFSVSFIAFFFMKEKFLVYRIIHILTPDKYEPKMQKAMRNINKMLSKYFRSIILQVVIFTLYIFLGLTIVGEKYALTVAIFSGIINLIPFIGPILGLLVALVFSFCGHIGMPFYNGILPESIQVIVVYLVSIGLDNFVSSPYIFSNSLKVHPLELFFVILAGGQLGGLTGMILAAPLYTIMRIMAKEFFNKFEFIQSITKNV